MTDEIRAVECPSCGAPIETPAVSKRYFQCQFCGTTLEDQTTPKERATGQYPKVTIHSPTTIAVDELVPDLAGGIKSTLRNLGCVLFIFAVVGVVIVGVIVSTAVEEESSSIMSVIDVEQPDDDVRVYSFGLTRFLPASDETQPDVIGVINSSDDTKRMVYVDFDAAPPLRWQSEPLGEGAGYVHNHIAASGSFIYMAYETTLAAFNRQDGSIVWQATLSDEVRNICKDCLQVFGERVVALTADGVLSGLNVQNGAPVWVVRLTETPRQLLNLAGQVGVVDEEDDVVGINVYEADGGTLVQRLVPQCPNEIFSDRPQTLGIYDTLLVSGDGQNLYVPLADYEPGCIQNWDAATLTQVWQATMPQDVVRRLDQEPYLLTAEALYTSDGNNLYVVTLEEGAYRDLFSDEDHDLVPLAAQDGILVVRAESTRGTRQFALWGIDIAAGAKLWRFDPTAQEPYDDEGGSSVVHGDGMWSAAIASGKVVVLQAFAEPNRVSFTLSNLGDGVQTGVNEFTPTNSGFGSWMQVLGWSHDQVYVELGGRLRVIDFTTATEIVAWP